MGLVQVRIVLVEPAGARNVGAVARVMKNMGLAQLVLVNPQCDPIGTEALHMAVHAADLLSQAQIVATLPDALQGVHRAAATLGRDTDRPLESPRQMAPWLLGEADVLASSGDPCRSALIFGAEDHGLSNDELKYAQRFVMIPASADYPSLNLAQAVGICCYELQQCDGKERSRAIMGTAGPMADRSPTIAADSPAALDQLEAFYQTLEARLLRIGYLHPHTATSRMEKLRRLLLRAQPTALEVTMLRGIMRQLDWALGPDGTPSAVLHPPERPADSKATF